jgi:uncharacterized protein YggE
LIQLDYQLSISMKTTSSPFKTHQFFMTVMVVLILVGAAGVVYTVDTLTTLSKKIWASDPNQIMYVTGSAKMKAMPDIAYVSYSAHADNKDVAKAASALAATVDKAISAFVKAGVAREDIFLSQYQVNRAMAFGGNADNAGNSDAAQNITVELRGSKEKLNSDLQTIDKSALASGLSPANNGGSYICLDFSDKAIFASARKDAVSDAYKQALGLTQATGLSLGRIVNVSDNMYGFGAANSPYANYCSTQLGSGRLIEEQTVPVSVNVNFEVK